MSLSHVKFYKKKIEKAVIDFHKTEEKFFSVFLNPHSYIVSIKDKVFSNSINKAKFIFCDGVGIWLTFLLYIRRIYRITGYEFLAKYFEYVESKKKKITVFLFGANDSTCKKIKKNIEAKFNFIKIIGYCSPIYFNKTIPIKYNKKYLNQINNSKADLLLVGLTAPKQEIWTYQNLNKLRIKKILPIGAVFDYLSKPYLYPPHLVRYIGLEWFYRLIMSPKKIYKRVFFSGLTYIYIFLFKKIFDDIKIKNSQILNLKKINSILRKKKFILSAINLSNLSYMLRDHYNFNHHFFWIDGLFGKIQFNKHKIAGYDLLKNLKIKNTIKKIIIIGNFNKKNKIYLKNLYGIPTKHIHIGFVDLYSIQEMALKIKPKYGDLILITLPTPKQEVIGNILYNKNKFCKIICIGGGLNIASGYEKIAPIFLRKFNLEFMWRLKYETSRRLSRLIKTFITYVLLNAKIKFIK